MTREATLSGRDFSPIDMSQHTDMGRQLLSIVDTNGFDPREYAFEDYRTAIDLALRGGLVPTAARLLSLARSIQASFLPLADACLDCDEARIALRSGNKIDAVRLIASSVHKLKTQNHRQQLAEALLFQGQVLGLFCQFESAIDSLNASLHFYEWEFGNRIVPLKIRNMIALIHKRRGKWAVAEDAMEKIVSITQEHDLQEHRWGVLGNLAVLRLKQGKVEKAVTSLSEIVRNSRAGNQAEVFNNAKLTLAIYDRMCGHFVHSRNAIREVKHWARTNNLVRTELLCYEYLADIRHDEGHALTALKLLNRALRLAKAKCPDTDLVCEVQRRRAEAFVDLGKVVLARRAANQAIRVSELIGEPFEIALAHRACGLVHESEGHPEAALLELKACVDILRQLGEKFELGRTLLHTARILIRNEGFSAGADTIEEARKIFLAMNLAYWVARADEVCLTRQIDASDDSSPTPTPRHQMPDQFGILTRDDRLVSMFSDLAKIATTHLPVILEGESGTGKELFAQALHQLSPRASKPFVPVNCGAIPKEMQESELFGHRRGSFTGAIEDNPGLLESATGGTLFLDEIGEMSPSAQVKLLRAIESNEVRRMGERQHRKIDVRYVAATNVDLVKAVAAGEFRKDLFYRLNGLRLTIPPLRERRGDIPLLVDFYVEQACTRLNKKVRVTRAIMNLLTSYEWPGNIRELKNSIERAVTLANPDSELTPGLFVFLVDNRGVPQGRTLAEDLEDVERQRILRTLDENGWVKAAAARVLKMTRTTLTSRMERLGIPLRRPRSRPQ